MWTRHRVHSLTCVDCGDEFNFGAPVEVDGRPVTREERDAALNSPRVQQFRAAHQGHSLVHGEDVKVFDRSGEEVSA